MPPKPTALQDTLGTLRPGNQAALMSALQRELMVEARGRLGTREGNESMWGQPAFYDNYGPGASQEELKKAASDIAFGAMTAPAAGGSLVKALQQTQARKLLGVAEDVPYSAPQVQQGKLGYQGGPAKIPAEPGYPYGQLKDEFIGTGEGNQAYGRGHYMAENQGVAKSYQPKGWKASDEYQYQGKAVEDHYADAIKKQDYDKATVWEMVQMHLSKDATLNQLQEYNKATRDFAKGLPDDVFAPPSGQLRQIAFKAQDDNLLHWDKPLSEQPKAVRDTLEPFIPDMRPTKLLNNQYGVTAIGRDGSGKNIVGLQANTPDEAMRLVTGEVLYNFVRKQKAGVGADIASTFKKAGIKGIKYLDGGSRNPGGGAVADTAMRVLNGVGGDAQKAIAELEKRLAVSNMPPGSSNIEGAIKWLKDGNNSTYNYVIFNPKDAKIIKTMGIGGVAGNLAGEDKP